MTLFLLLGAALIAVGVVAAWPSGETAETYTFIGWLLMIAGGYVAGLGRAKGHTK